MNVETQSALSGSCWDAKTGVETSSVETGKQVLRLAVLLVPPGKPFLLSPFRAALRPPGSAEADLPVLRSRDLA